MHLALRPGGPKNAEMSISAAAVRLPLRLGDGDRAVAALLAALELRHPGTCRHAERVADLALNLTSIASPELALQEGLGHAYLLHDIGKIGIPDAILLKPDRLTPSEMRVVRRHPRLGEDLVRRLRFLSPLVRDVVGCHHERWDGCGYPRQLAGPNIPLAARIFAVVDAFDAMTHLRPYREPVAAEDALAEVERCSGTQFDPSVVAAFLSMVGVARRVGRADAEGRPPATRLKSVAPQGPFALPSARAPGTGRCCRRARSRGRRVRDERGPSHADRLRDHGWERARVQRHDPA